MGRIITFSQIEKNVKEIKKKRRTIVLAGGCFDILHFGHFKFLEKAKKQGDVLMVALESDENVRRLKGEKRPIHTINERAFMLSGLTMIDYIILLPSLTTNQDYSNLVTLVSPQVIAITADDPKLSLKKEQAGKVKAKIKAVIPRLKKYSTTEIIKFR